MDKIYADMMGAVQQSPWLRSNRPQIPINILQNCPEAIAVIACGSRSRHGSRCSPQPARRRSQDHNQHESEDLHCEDAQGFSGISISPVFGVAANAIIPDSPVVAWANCRARLRARARAAASFAYVR